MDDPGSTAQWAHAAKSMFDMFRSALGLVREASEASESTPAQQQAIEAALGEAEQAAGVVQAQIAQALGYELCRCQFPPTPMLTVGFRTRHLAPGESRTVYECPVCGFHTAAPYNFDRTPPKQEDKE